MEYIFKLIELINPAQLVAMGIMLWFFYNRLDCKIEKNNQRIDRVEQNLTQKIDQVDAKLSQRIDQVEQKLTQRIDNVYALIINLFQIKRIDDISNNQDKAA